MRRSWDETLIPIARILADSQSDCRRSSVAAIVFDEQNERIVSTGVNGLASGCGSCLNGDCPRGLLSQEELPSYSSFDSGAGLCNAVHAEARAIIMAGLCARGATIYVTREPCHGCSVLILGAGITRVVVAS